MRFKGGKREDMGVLERAFARIYDRLRKRALRRRSGLISTWVADAYYQGARDALDEVGELLEREDIGELAELRGAGV